MSYYADLTPYNYHHYSEKELNVGWLQKEQPFSVGECPEGFIEKLKVYSEQDNIIFQTKGFHSCEFCQDNKFSSNEMRVVGEDGSVYASPYMIIHYIEEHKYLPPQKFIDAVINGPAPETQEYKTVINKLVESWQRRRPDTNDEDYEYKMKMIMIENLTKEVDKKIMDDIINENTNFQKFVEAYNKIMPSVYAINFKK